MANLEPIEPEHAVELYLTKKEPEYAPTTLQSYRTRLMKFAEWCDLQGIDNLNDLTGRMFHDYQLWRREEGDPAPSTEKSQMDTLRVFVRWLGTIDGVDPDLHIKVKSPTLDPDDQTRDVLLDNEAAEEVLDYLATYEYASIEHVTMALLWRTMMRRGAAHALDVDDYHPDEEYIEVVHRPETDTPIKNGKKGERLVALSTDMCSLLDNWLADRRPDVTDDHGREPLLATYHGRVHLTTIQRYCYLLTRPCVYAECPHDREFESCEAASRDSASKCPSSVSPHAVRRGSITHHLQNDVPEKAVGDRANVSQKVLEKHYDRRSAREKMEQRRGFLDNI